jgi:hypothetical protein
MRLNYLVQKFGIDPANLKVAEVAQLSDAELIDVSKHFPVLNNPMKMKKSKRFCKVRNILI